MTGHMELLLAPVRAQPGYARRGHGAQKLPRQPSSAKPAVPNSIWKMAETGRELGIAFAFDRMQRTPNTRLAHRLIWEAGRQGRQDAMVERLFHGYFEEEGGYRRNRYPAQSRRRM